METHHVRHLGPLVGHVDELLAQYGTLHAAGFTWHPKPNAIHSFESKYHPTSQSADEETIRILKQMGYTEPRWFEYWRWGEPRPSDNVLKAFRK